MSLLEQNMRKKVFLGQDGNSLVLLVAFNVILYIFLSFLNIVYLSNNSTTDTFIAQVVSWFSVPGPPQVFASRPWTLILYMFTHINIWELVSSMLWLWCFGYILQSLTGNNKLIPVYLYGGFAGSVIFVLTVNLVPALRANINSVVPLMGAGPALMAVSVAATAIAPKYRIFPMINFPLWALTGIFVLLRLGTVGMGNAGHAAALLAGGLMGYVYVWQLQQGNNIGQWMVDFIDWLNDLFNPNKKHKQTPAKNQLFYKAIQKPFEKTPHVTQQRVDELLDKINHKGYHSLTDEEKEFLKKASQEEL